MTADCTIQNQAKKRDYFIFPSFKPAVALAPTPTLTHVEL